MEYLDVQSIDPTRFVFYEKRTVERGDPSMTLIEHLSGIPGNTPHTIHKHVAFNQFESKESKIPRRYLRVESPSDDWIKKYYYNAECQYIDPMKVPEYDQPYYYTHDNGDRPFIVYLNDNNMVTVYVVPNFEDNMYMRETDKDRRYDDEDKEFERQLYQKKVYEAKYERIFIGESPLDEMTSFSGGSGPKFDGNSILLHLHDLEYVFIGNSIQRLTALSPITYYQSSVGNNDIPYPFAVDDQDNYYLLIEDVIMHNRKNLYRHPYHLYYDIHNMISHKYTNFEDKQYAGYKGFYIGDETHLLRWRHDPEHGFDRLVNNEDWKDQPFTLRKLDDTSEPLTKELYMNLMKQFAEEHKLSKLEMTTLEKRRW